MLSCTAQEREREKFELASPAMIRRRPVVVLNKLGTFQTNCSAALLEPALTGSRVQWSAACVKRHCFLHGPCEANRTSFRELMCREHTCLSPWAEAPTNECEAAIVNCVYWCWSGAFLAKEGQTGIGPTEGPLHVEEYARQCTGCTAKVGPSRALADQKMSFIRTLHLFNCHFFLGKNDRVLIR